MDAFDEPLLDIEALPGPPPKKVYDFYATVAGGMEDIALAEMKAHLGRLDELRVVRGRRLSRIFFHYERSPKKLLAIRSVAQIHVLLASVSGVTVGQPGLLRIAQRVGQVDLIPAAILHDILYGVKDEVGFRLSCTTGKGHRFAASELHQIVQTILTMKYEVDEDVNRPYVLHLRVDGKRALFGLQLVTQRDWERAHYPVQIRGDLEASVAFALAQIMRLRAGDVVLNLGCGGGQVLCEAGLAQMPGFFVGLDFFLDGVQGMRENANDAGVSVSGIVSESGVLPIVRGGITKAIANLVPRKGVPPASLFSVLEELVRVIEPGGQAFLIYDERRVFARMLEDFPYFKLLKRRPLHLQGKHLDLFILQRI